MRPKLVFILYLSLLISADKATKAEVSNDEAVAFEVVSIRLHNPALQNTWDYRLPAIYITGTDVINLVSAAFNLDSSQITGVPEWTRFCLYDIQAKADPQILALTPDKQNQAVEAMLQSMLVARFHLRYQTSTAMQQTQWLILGKNTAKLKPAPAGEVTNALIGIGRVDATTYSMSALAKQLSFSTHTSLINKTNLSGKYDFSLHWNADGFATDEDLPTLPEAIREQLGLDVKYGKSPRVIFKIEHLEKPSPN